MSNHVVAINVLKDELELIAAKVTYLRSVLAGFALIEAITSDVRSANVYRGLRYQRALKNQLERGNALIKSIKVLEGDN
jgi:hypothetical protein